MKNLPHNATMGATAGCTLRLLEGSNNGSCIDGHGIKGDAWFGSVRTAMEIGARGGEAVLQVKGNKGLYPKDFIEETLKEAPGGVSVVLTGIAPNGVQLVAVGYRYSVKTTLFFVFTGNAGSTKPGDPYMMKYTDSYGNLCSREVERPAAISDFFAESNTIDRHNQSRQYDLAIEKAWVTKDCYFRLSCTMMGMHVTDSWKLADYHKIINYSTKSNKRPMTIQRFGGVLGRQLIHYASTCSKAQPHQPQSEKENIPPSLTSDSFSFNMSSLSDNLVDGSSPTVLIPIRSLADCQGVVHHQVKLPMQVGKNGKRYTKQRPCKQCKGRGDQQDTTFYCFTCGLSASFCCPTEKTTRDCFKEHVDEIIPPCRTTRSLTAV